jgi:hypothetical protein
VDGNMNKFLTIIKALALVAVTAILGLLGAPVLADVITYRVPHGAWQPVSLGQERADKILGAREYGTMAVYYYIQTDQGNMYRCHATQCERVLSAEEVISGFDQSCGEPRFAVPRPPGVVRDSFVRNWCGLCTGQTSSIILSDGSVWNWETVGCCEVGCLVILAYPYCGLGTGLLTGIVILFLIWVGRQRRKATLSMGRISPANTQGK